VPVEVVVVEPTGSETLIVVKGGQTELDCLFRSRILPNPGETLRIQPDIAHVHLFDAESGHRLE
jgi:multiple sugar transport system ATP-binding protein